MWENFEPSLIQTIPTSKSFTTLKKVHQKHKAKKVEGAKKPTKHTVGRLKEWSLWAWAEFPPPIWLADTNFKAADTWWHKRGDEMSLFFKTTIWHKFNDLTMTH